MEEFEENRYRNYLLITGPMGGFDDPRSPELPMSEWTRVTWTAKRSETAVRRFLAEAKYYLAIYNIVVQHFVSILFEKYYEEDPDTERGTKKRDRFYAVLWNAKELNELLNSKAGVARAALPEEEGHEEIDLAVDDSFQSLRELMASSASIHDSENVPEVGSLEELREPLTSGEPSLFSRLKERFAKHLDDELAKLRSKFVTTLPEFAQRNTDRINRLVSKTINYSDYITKVEHFIDRVVKWSAWDGRHPWRRVDLRDRNFDKANHVICAPFFLIEELQNIFVHAYSLLLKTTELEQVMRNKDPDEYAKLQESKAKILFPTEHVLELP